jgi:hypothetical protein
MNSASGVIKNIDIKSPYESVRIFTAIFPSNNRDANTNSAEKEPYEMKFEVKTQTSNGGRLKFQSS